MVEHRFQCIDGHTGGMPVRLVVDGAPKLDGKTQSERRQHFLQDYDWIRKALMLEPRGHNVMSGALFYPPMNPDFDMGLIYIETSGSLPMCGHGTIGSVTFALEQGLVTPAKRGEVRVETPAGLVLARYEQTGNRVVWVELTNVPSFLMYPDITIESASLGVLSVDIAYGGNFYPIIEPQKNYTDASDYPVQQLLQMGWEIQCLINQTMEIVHPLDPSLHGVKHCMWTGQPRLAGSSGRSVVIAGQTLVDRSPCGTGTSARVAQRVARGLLRLGEEYVHESIIGSRFTSKATQQVKIGGYEAVVPTVRGSAWITGLNTILVDPDAPFATGFVVE